VLGHRRLAIIDLASGRQPLSNEDGRIWVTYNGEIYNYRELRTTLQARGHRFRTASDTEVLVHAWEEWGERLVERLRGMFALALFDREEGRLFLARDHFGIKPLYYLHTPGGLAFASELQALRVVPEVPWDLDHVALDQYLWLQYVPAPRTAFAHVRKLPPAHHLSVFCDGRITGARRYWRLAFEPDHRPTAGEWLERTDAVVRDSVRVHLVSDVPFGAFLSGGIDSTLIVGYMAQILAAPVETFSIGFEEPEFNELPWSAAAAERWGTRHHADIVRQDGLDILPALVRHFGEPFGDSSALPTFFVSQAARRHVPMVLSGDGGDEAFAGYRDYLRWQRWLGQDDQPAWKQRAFPNEPALGRWLAHRHIIDPARRETLWGPDRRDLIGRPVEALADAWAAADGCSPVQRVQALEFESYLPYSVLTKVDVASMMHGLEVRTPLVDIEVARLAASVPETIALGSAPDGQPEGKHLLKSLVGRYFSDAFVRRDKMGFGVPIERWFAPATPTHDAIRDRLSDRSSPLSDLFQPCAIESIVADGAYNPIWLLLVLDEWLRQAATAAR
jgi:asparagine synthase (glutamine-hydrolysing)